MSGSGAIHVEELDGSERSLYGSADSLGDEEVTTMAMLQRDDSPTPRLRRTGTIEAINRLDALLEYAVMHNEKAEADRLRAALRRLTEEI